MNKLIEKLKNEEANSLVENVIIMPLIFIILYAIIMTCFIIHDRATLDGAAKRGALYAAHCIADPNYDDILRKSGSSAGSLDTSVDITQEGAKFDFSQNGKDIKAYRYINNSSSKINEKVTAEIKAIIENTRIQWRDLKVEDIQYSCKNYFLYQEVTVTLEAHYPMAKFFKIIGLDDGFDYTVTAKMTVNDPDEFIRNADLVVDTIVQIDNKCGNKISESVSKVTDTFKKLATAVLDWVKMDE